MDWIAIKPNVMFGKPVVKDTRITVELILEELSVGRSHEELLKDYQNLEEQHIHVALPTPSKVNVITNLPHEFFLT